MRLTASFVAPSAATDYCPDLAVQDGHSNALSASNSASAHLLVTASLFGDVTLAALGLEDLAVAAIVNDLKNDRRQHKS